MKPEQTACTSKAAPCVMPSPACTVVAVAGNVSSGVVVQHDHEIDSPASMPAPWRGACSAPDARSEVFSPSAAMRRSRMPVRLRIHSSEVSTALREIVIGDDLAGRYAPHADHAVRGHHELLRRPCRRRRRSGVRDWLADLGM